jgi:DNA adenine methylase
MNALIKYPGGKSKLKHWIINNFSTNYETFIDMCVGGGSIILNKPLSKFEIINDKDPKLINLYNIVKYNCKEFINQLSHVQYNEDIFNNALVDDDFYFEDAIDSAVNYYILYRMSRGALGKTFAWSNRLRGNQIGDINAWKNNLDNIENISNRLRNVEILNKDFRDILNQYNNEKIFIYIDPVYLKSTRKSKDVYKYEMSEKDHKDLLILILQNKSKILISGYQSNLYQVHLNKWNRYEKLIVNHSSQSTIKELRTEVLWANF